MPNPTDTTQVFQVLTGALLPALIAAINQSHFSPRNKALVALLAILGAATMWIFYLGTFDVVNITATVRTIMTTAVVMYLAVYKPTGASDAIEKSINPGPDDQTN